MMIDALFIYGNPKSSCGRISSARLSWFFVYFVVDNTADQFSDGETD